MATLPAAAAMILITPLITPLAVKIGTRMAIAGGFGLAAVGFAALAFVEASWTYAMFVIPLAVLSAGLGLANGPASSASTPGRRRGTGRPGLGHLEHGPLRRRVALGSRHRDDLQRRHRGPHRRRRVARRRARRGSRARFRVPRHLRGGRHRAGAADGAPQAGSAHARSTGPPQPRSPPIPSPRGRGLPPRCPPPGRPRPARRRAAPVRSFVVDDPSDAGNASDIRRGRR